jgi:hypothetical protein
MKYPTGIALSCVLLASTSPGLAQNRADSSVVRTVAESDLVALANAEGHTVDEITSTEDMPAIIGLTPDGLYYELHGMSCREEAGLRCDGVEMLVFYEADADMTADKINDANYYRAAVKTYWYPTDQEVGIGRYIILDDGVTWLNLRQNLRVLLNVQEDVRAKLFD